MTRTLIAVALIAACSGNKDTEPQQSVEPAEEAVGGAEPGPIAPLDAAEVRASARAFAAELHRHLVEGDGNAFASPASVGMAVAMVSGGARGDTLAGISRALQVPDARTLHGANHALLTAWNAGNADYELAVANRLWAASDARLVEGYVALTRDSYLAPLDRLDFADPGSVDAVNGWVSDQTHGKIRDLFSELAPDTKLVLANAIYFRGTWEKPFDPAKTATAPFTTLAGQQVDADLMYGKVFAGYAEKHGVQAVGLPYAGKRLSMVVLLPKDVAKLKELEAALDGDAWAEWAGALASRDVKVWLPKFRVESRYSLNEPLSAMGMGAAFSDQADLSGIVAGGGVKVDAAVHQAFVEVDEKGTEAAGATGMTFRPTSLPPPAVEFRADHPFLFAIWDREEGVPLFLGRLADPSTRRP